MVPFPIDMMAIVDTKYRVREMEKPCGTYEKVNGCFIEVQRIIRENSYTLLVYIIFDKNGAHATSCNGCIKEDDLLPYLDIGESIAIKDIRISRGR